MARVELGQVAGAQIHANPVGVRDRLPGLKFMRTLWVCEITGGPFKFSPTKPGKTYLGLEEAHRNFKISPEEFDEVAAELGRSAVARVAAATYRVPNEELATVGAIHGDEIGRR